MNLDDVKERLKSEFARLRERVEENSTFVTLRDRYQSQSPLMQKLIAGGTVAVILLVILSVPYGSFETSHQNIADFEAKRSLIRDLLRVQKEINETPEIALPPPVASVKSRIESDLQAAQLLPEQMKGVNVLPPTQSELVKSPQNEGVVEVNLSSLNLKQIVDFGYQFQSISPSVKLKDLVVQANTKMPGYFEVVYRLLVLKVQSEEVPAEEPPAKKGKR